MKILIGYKGINIGQDLLKLGAEHAKAFNATVLVVTSMLEGTEKDQKKILEAENNLDQAQVFFTAQGIACEKHLLIRGMEAGEDIVAFANEKKVDEIIIGVKSRSNVGKLLFGSTAQTVILEADCPVITVR
ncbi:universal stress protein [Desulfobacter postgatei]|jgi:nucleotide-binding universal stress UspA family protein|uniref:Universal stress protein UspA-like protein n=1 Tax=Desulfobacter postgatei 2ac9 TaxID=879212 RepID=I5B370_9BACT|nr:universal stress protein [Desulfobacter postgatei]EIM63933.1 universal stress protein UspA-like protein [Desulfobacter postgatei 2ac9]MDX9964574.1 universal stress protein [Desulfobacter postgatei]